MPEQIDWNRIENFVGYGRKDAPVVFVGIEEGLSKEEKLQQNLLRRSAFKSIMDIKLAHAGIAGTAALFSADRTKCQRTWRAMCDLMLRRADHAIQPNCKTRNRYQAQILGRTKGNTLLTELLPYPHKKTNDWLHVYRRRYRTRTEYEDDMLPIRIELLSGVLAQYPRELIVCYGKGKWDQFSDLIQRAFHVKGVSWVAEPDTSRNRSHVKEAGVVRKSAVINGTRMVLVTHLSGKEFNSDKQLAAFASVANG